MTRRFLTALALLALLLTPADMGLVWQDCPGEATDLELRECTAGWSSWPY